MSTRTQIRIAGTKALIYQHCDGYPRYMLETLLPFIAEFHKYRGPDPEYMVARLVARMINRREKEMEEFYKESPELRMPERGPDFCGYGIDTELHGDIEYLYDIDESGNLTVSTSRYYKNYTKRKFIKVAKFKIGTTYADAMARLTTLAANKKSLEHVAA